jgi:WXXGXW repeat (2 copies)
METRSPALEHGLQTRLLALSLAALLGTGATGCFRHGGNLFGAMAWTAILTTAIVSSHPPPREVVVVEAAPREGYSWQPGYWAPYEGRWVWVPGRYIQNHPGYVWNPSHWVEDGSGNWRLIPGEWIPSPIARSAPPSAPAPDDDEGDEPPPPAQ